MYYVYLIRSINFPDKNYTGYTANLEMRLSVHNSGGSKATQPYRPWELIAYVAFNNEAQAIAFETYLKSGSGREFARRKLWGK